MYRGQRTGPGQSILPSPAHLAHCGDRPERCLPAAARGLPFTPCPSQCLVLGPFGHRLSQAIRQMPALVPLPPDPPHTGAFVPLCLPGQASSGCGPGGAVLVLWAAPGLQGRFPRWLQWPSPLRGGGNGCCSWLHSHFGLLSSLQWKNQFFLPDSKLARVFIFSPLITRANYFTTERSENKNS